MHRQVFGVRAMCRGIGLLATALVIALAAFSQTARAAQTVQTFYIPVTEEQGRTYETGIGATPSSDYRTVISITATFDGTIIYYDEWEDGYEYDLTNPTQSTTKVFGDGDAANGAPPGCAADLCDVVDAGSIVILDNNATAIPANPRDQGNIYYDARDKFGSTQQLVVTRAGWAPTPGVVLSDAVEVFDTRRWGTSYLAPAGQNSAAGTVGTQFTYTALAIMAERDGTVVTVDADGPLGGAAVNYTVNQGESLYIANTNQYATVSSTGGTVQVDLLAGVTGSNYAGRWWSLVPVADWDTSYYSPVGTASAGGARVILYNPDAAAITVTVDRSGGSSTVSVPAGGIATYTMVAGSGAHLYTTGAYAGKKFFAIASVDWNAQAYDWGYTLIPEASLTPAVVLGWAPGSDPYATPPLLDVSKLWVTPVAGTTVYVDYDGDPTTGPSTVTIPGLPPPDNHVHYDTFYTLTALQSQRISDAGDLDLTGARVFTVDGVRLAAAWGPDPATGTTGLPALDLGTTVLPFNSLTAYKYSRLLGDFNGNGGIDPGEVIEYSIRVHNSGIIPISGAVLTDTLDANTTYVAGTTYIDGTLVPDDAGGGHTTLFLFDEGGLDLVPYPALLQPNQDITVVFQATVNITSTAKEITNTAMVNSVVAAEQFSNVNISATALGALATTKSSAVVTPPIPPPARDLIAGDVVAYTVTVSNTSTTPQNGVTLSDPQAVGSNYVANSTAVTGWREKIVKDVFDTLLYSNNDGPENWAVSWTENDAGSAVPNAWTAGDVQVINGEVRIGVNGSWVRRTVDLQEFSALAGRTASLRLSYRTNPYVQATDVARVQIAPDGATFADLTTLTGIAGATSGTLSFTLAAANITANTTVRLIITSGYGLNGANQKHIYFDKVEVRATGSTKSATDNFTGAIAYNLGPNWAGNWIEGDNAGSAQNPAAGNVMVAANAGNNGLRIKSSTGATTAVVGNYASRMIFADGVVAATLSFDVAASNTPAGTVSAQISRDGTTFTTLETFGNVAVSRSYDISAYLSATTTIRFIVATVSGNNQRYHFFDNIVVTAGKHLAVTKDNIAGGANPDLVNGQPPDPATGLPAGPVVSQDGFALAPGESMTMTYRVQMKSPPNVTRLVNTVTVTSWEKAPPASATTIDPVSPGGAIGDQIWLDADADGVFDVGEQGLVNVRVFDDANGNGSFDAGEASTLTGGHGTYFLSGLAPGTYDIRIDTTSLPPGLRLSFGAYPTSRTIANDYWDNVDFGFIPDSGYAVLGNFVWSDANFNGAQDSGEVGISGVYLALITGFGVDGLPCTADDVLVSPPRTTVTGIDGTYLFTGVTPGTYRVCADVGPNGIPGDGDLGEGALSGYSPTVGPQSAGHLYSAEITVVADEIRTDADFGFRNPLYKSISDRIWYDYDNNGLVDLGEPGIAGVTVNLFAAGLVKGSVVTDADGNFTFPGLPNGTYTITIEDADGKLLSFSGTTTAAQAGMKSVTLAGSDISATSFGYNNPGRIGDQLWSDADGDGILDPGEAGIAGVLVRLYFDTNGNGLLDIGTDSQVGSDIFTDAAGRYDFQVGTAGRYFVSVPPQNGVGEPLEGFTLTTPDSDPALGSQVRIDLYNLLTSDLSADFGYRNPARHAISGFVFSDDNQNGSFAAPEGGLSGITIDLLDGTGNLVASTASAADGSYAFTGLPNGTYTIRVTDTTMLLDDWTQTSPALPAPPERTVTLAGADSTGNNFGFYKKPTRVFLAKFTATATTDGALVRWETTTEIGTAGYFLYRVDGGVEMPVNDDIVPALLESSSGGTYTLLDRGASGKRLLYLLVEVLAQGTQVAYGPFPVTLQPMTAGRQVSADTIDLSHGTDYTRLRHPPSPRESEPSVAAATGEFDTRALAPAVAPSGIAKLTILHDGLYRVNASDIAPILGTAAAQTRTLISSGLVTLVHNGTSVAYLPVDMGAGLLFYGQGADTVFTGESVYWLARGKSKTMQSVRTVFSRAERSGQTFVAGAHAEENRIPNTASAMDPRADYWYWDYLVAGSAGLGKKSFPILTPGATSIGKATLTVSLRGGTDTAADPDHHVVVKVNGTPVGESRWNGMESLAAPFSFDQGLLVDGENTVEIEAALDAGVRYSVLYLDSLDISYHRRFEAVGDRIAIRAAGNSPVTVSGFSSREIRVFEMTIAQRPRLVTATRIGGRTGNYTVTFQPYSASTPYLVVSDAGIAGSPKMLPWISSALTDSSNAADYLIITGSAMTGSAEALAEHRRTQGLTAKVVTVGAIMDEFNAGAYDPEAIRRFLTLAESSWTLPPRYVLLAGDGSFDYRDHLGYGECIVPPAMIPTSYGLFPSDAWFVDDDADHVPSLAIGRLPAKTNAELQAMVDKIIAYETATAAPPAAVLFTADQPDESGNFTGDSNALLSLVPPEYDRATAHLAEMDIASARDRVTGLLNSGVSQVNYVGHAGYDRLADEGLLLTTDVPSLTNASAPPLFTIFSCLAGSFSDPGYENLGEALVLKPDGGAVAVFAPTGLTINDRSVRLGGEFLRLRFSSGPAPRLGDLVLGAMQAYAAGYSGDDTLDLYGILGDPALVLR